MTRRLVIVIVGVVVATLLLAGLGTLVLAAARARTTTENELRAQTTEFAANIADFLVVDAPIDTPEGQRQLKVRIRLLQRLKNVLPLEDVVVVAANARGEYNLDQLPSTVTLTDADIAALQAGETISGVERRVAFAAAPAATPKGRPFLVVASRRVDAALGAAFRLFLWAAAATILLGIGAAYVLGKRLSKPVREAAAAAHAIAGGEFSTRVPEPAADNQDELADLHRSINHMAATLERSRTLEQQFLLSVSHDLRTPLTSIRGYAEAIDDGNVDPRRAAAVIRDESRRLERLVADLLDLAKLQTRSFTFHLAPVDLSAAVHTATAGVEPSRPDITFHPVTSGAVPVQADPDRLAQVLANLLENAGKYANNAVHVAARVEGDRGIVTVDDDGPGIAPEDLPHVFERLYTARRMPQRTENASGLGLAIVKELVNAMGGDVAAGAAPRGGARMTFWLPLRT